MKSNLPIVWLTVCQSCGRVLVGQGVALCSCCAALAVDVPEVMQVINIPAGQLIQPGDLSDLPDQWD